MFLPAGYSTKGSSVSRGANPLLWVPEAWTGRWGLFCCSLSAPQFPPQQWDGASGVARKFGGALHPSAMTPPVDAVCRDNCPLCHPAPVPALQTQIQGGCWAHWGATGDGRAGLDTAVGRGDTGDIGHSPSLPCSPNTPRRAPKAWGHLPGDTTPRKGGRGSALPGGSS